MVTFRAAVLLTILFVLAPLQAAAAVDHSLGQFQRTDFTSTNGAPESVNALAQTKEGYIWIGTADGLYRFDGITFEHIRPLPGRARSQQVTSLHAARNGDLWVGFFWGGLARVRNGRLENVNDPDHSGVVEQFAKDADGGIWIVSNGNRGRLTHFTGRIWDRGVDNWGLGDGRIEGLIAGRDGKIWVATTTAILVLMPGARRFVPVIQPVAAHTALGLSPDGHIWVSDIDGVHAIAPGDHPTFKLRQTELTRDRHNRQILFDRQGGVWTTGDSTDIVRLTWNAARIRSRPDHVDQIVDARLPTRDAVTRPLLEDREGNVWLGTSTGLVRFAPSAVSLNPLPKNAQGPPGTGSIRITRDNSVYFTNGSQIYIQQEAGNPRLLADLKSRITGSCVGNDRPPSRRRQCWSIRPIPSSTRPFPMICASSNRSIGWSRASRGSNAIE